MGLERIDVVKANQGCARETEINWEKATDDLRQRLRGELFQVDETDLDDLTQEASVRLLRVVRREGARELTGLINVIARRTARDFIRRRYRWMAVFRGASEADLNRPDGQSASPEMLGDPQERVEFLVLEFFRRRGSSCLELARAFFEERDWASVAGSLGTTHDAIRARWSRCLSLLRKAVATDPECHLLAALGAD